MVSSTCPCLGYSRRTLLGSTWSCHNWAQKPTTGVRLHLYSSGLEMTLSAVPSEPLQSIPGHACLQGPELVALLASTFFDRCDQTTLASRTVRSAVQA